MYLGLNHFNTSSGDAAEKALDNLVVVIVEPSDTANGNLTSSEQEAIERLVTREKRRECDRLLNK